MGFKLKITRNKANNQLRIDLPRSKFRFLRNRVPKFLDVTKLNEDDFT